MKKIALIIGAIIFLLIGAYLIFVSERPVDGVETGSVVDAVTDGVFSETENRFIQEE